MNTSGRKGKRIILLKFIKIYRIIGAKKRNFSGEGIVTIF
jgi:hypothetical protein